MYDTYVSFHFQSSISSFSSFLFDMLHASVAQQPPRAIQNLSSSTTRHCIFHKLTNKIIAIWHGSFGCTRKYIKDRYRSSRYTDFHKGELQFLHPGGAYLASLFDITRWRSIQVFTVSCPWVIHLVTYKGCSFPALTLWIHFPAFWLLSFWLWEPLVLPQD